MRIVQPSEHIVLGHRRPHSTEIMVGANLSPVRLRSTPTMDGLFKHEEYAAPGGEEVNTTNERKLRRQAAKIEDPYYRGAYLYVHKIRPPKNTKVMKVRCMLHVSHPLRLD